jgi:hypothetical protein
VLRLWIHACPLKFGGMMWLGDLLLALLLIPFYVVITLSIRWTVLSMSTLAMRVQFLFRFERLVAHFAIIVALRILIHVPDSSPS